MISITEVEIIHTILINRFGGAHGIRDIEALKSAIARPFQAFDNTDLYPTLLEKAASLIESILVNHPFVDGNKRSGYMLLRIFLLSNNLDLSASQDNKYEFVIGVASGILKYDGILAWLKLNTKEVKS
jgi:death on curing protein